MLIIFIFIIRTFISSHLIIQFEKFEICVIIFKT